MNSLEVIFKDKIKFEPYKVFEVNNKKNIYTTNIGGIYEIDENVMHVLNEDGKTLDEIYNNLSTKLKKDDIDKILNNMIDLKILRLKNEEIIENDYNLNIPRYVDTFEEEEVTPLPDVMKELNEVRQEIEKTSKELFGLLDQLEGTTPEAKEELAKFMELLK